MDRSLDPARRSLSPELMNTLRFALLVAVLSVGAQAQTLTDDPRSLTGLDVSSIPVVHSIEEFQSLRSGRLEAAATTSRPGALIPFSTVSRQSLGPTRGGPTSTPIRLERAENGTVRWLEGELDAGLGLARARGAAARVAAAETVLDAFAPALRLIDPASELEVVRTNTDDLGSTHVRFQQRYQNIPVWNAELIAHLDAAGTVYAVNGTYHPTPDLEDVTPSLSPTGARDAAISALEDAGRWNPVSAEVSALLDLGAEPSELVVYHDGIRFRLAYALEVHASLLELFEMVVDANTGAVLERIDRHCAYAGGDHVPHVDLEAETLAPAMIAARGQFTNAGGTDLNGVSQSLRAWRADDGTHFMLSDLDNLNVGASQLPNNPSGGTLTLTAQNQDFNENTQLAHVTSGSTSFTDAAAVSASYGMDQTYAYFRDTFGRKAIDDNNQTMISIVHITQNGQSMGNAFWLGRIMGWGDGDSNFKPLAGALDVAGHEMSHGVIQHTADLVYKNQPGALNESIADVFGVMVDRDDFLAGEDIMRSALALRDLENPDNPNVLSPQPAHMRDFRNLREDQDNGGVHVNSGIPNRAAVLAIQAIGREKVEQIWYRGLSTYLTRESQFVDGRLAFERAATDLYGAGSAEVQAVSNAFAAVGIGDANNGGGGGQNPGGDDVPPLVGGQSLVAFMTGNGSVGTVDLTDPNNIGAGLFQGATARFGQDGDASQLSAPRDGASIWYVNPNGQLEFVDVASGQVSTFDNLSLQQPGDLWTVSISPDASVVAIVSAYLNDPRIYLFDGQNLSILEVRPETTAEGFRDETIQYPDVITWSPNADQPLLAFDALHQSDGGPLFGGLSTYWALHEVDFDAGRVYNVLPPQPSGVSVGNPTYSSSDPDVMAFDVADEQGVVETYLADFSAGQVATLGTTDLTFNGQPITDAQRPTFSPDDRTVLLSVPSAASLLFMDRTGADPTALTFQEPLFNPSWFVIGGTPRQGVSSETGPNARFDLEVAPNPIGAQARVSFSVLKAASVRVAVYDALGREVAVLEDGMISAGEHDVRLDAAALPAGVYVVRLEAGGAVEVRTITVVR
ncbi:M4 family metallopeptidase [Rubrivirga sp.]|uniref:M4 family metallopeptidase n=1 Tax=Rubrivirga sp. TaxID=1885344 RepID=UPI003C724AE6